MKGAAQRLAGAIREFDAEHRPVIERILEALEKEENERLVLRSLVRALAIDETSFLMAIDELDPSPPAPDPEADRFADLLLRELSDKLQGSPATAPNEAATAQALYEKFCEWERRVIARAAAEVALEVGEEESIVTSLLGDLAGHNLDSQTEQEGSAKLGRFRRWLRRRDKAA